MAKIDFNKIPCYTSISKQDKQEKDFREDFANIIYMKGNGIAMGALALKIYNSTGEEEYNEQECQIILKMAKLCNPVFYDSIKELIEGAGDNS